MQTYQHPRPSVNPFYTLDGQYKASAADAELENARIRAREARQAHYRALYIARRFAEVA
jgi:hypothetical protein